MKLRNFLAAGLSACLAAGTLTLCAGAEQPRFKLLVQPAESYYKDSIFATMYYASPEETSVSRMVFLDRNNSTGRVNALCDVTADDLAHWQQTGKFRMTNINCGIDLATEEYFTDGYSTFITQVPQDPDSAPNSFFYDYDGSGGLTVIPLNCGNAVAGFDGMAVVYELVEEDGNPGIMTASLTLVTAVGAADTVSLSGLLNFDIIHNVGTNREYAAFLIYRQQTPQGEPLNHISAMTSEGKIKELYTSPSPSGGLYSVSGSMMTIATCNRDYSNEVDILYDNLTGEYVCYAFPEVAVGSINLLDLSDDHGYANIIAEDGSYVFYSVRKTDRLLPDRTGANGEPVYEAELVGGPYSFLNFFADDPKLAEGLSGERDYIDENGNVLMSYDNCSQFLGEYALAAEDSEIFLIDKEFRQVSDRVAMDYKPEAFMAFKDGLFGTEGENCLYLVTYSEADLFTTAESTEESHDTTEITETAEAPEAPAEIGGEKGNPNTGAGIAGAMFLTITAAGALALSKRGK